MNIRFKLYLNNLYFDSIYDNDFYGDRVETHRMLEKVLWTMYQLLKSGDHQLIITNKDQVKEQMINNSQEFENWVKEIYPSLSTKLNHTVHTQSPHPNDFLVK